MSTDCKMTIDERRKYLRVMKKRYRQASRKGRGWAVAYDLLSADALPISLGSAFLWEQAERPQGH